MEKKKKTVCEIWDCLCWFQLILFLNFGTEQRCRIYWKSAAEHCRCHWLASQTYNRDWCKYKIQEVGDYFYFCKIQLWLWLTCFGVTVGLVVILNDWKHNMLLQNWWFWIYSRMCNIWSAGYSTLSWLDSWPSGMCCFNFRGSSFYIDYEKKGYLIYSK